MTAIDTSSIHVRALHPAMQLCAGCGRTLGEIAHWTELTDAEHSKVFTRLHARLAALTAAGSGADLAAA